MKTPTEQLIQKLPTLCEPINIPDLDTFEDIIKDSIRIHREALENDEITEREEWQRRAKIDSLNFALAVYRETKED